MDVPLEALALGERHDEAVGIAPYARPADGERGARDGAHNPPADVWARARDRRQADAEYLVALPQEQPHVERCAGGRERADRRRYERRAAAASRVECRPEQCRERQYE